jgi:hypothetical protein
VPSGQRGEFIHEKQFSVPPRIFSLCLKLFINTAIDPTLGLPAGETDQFTMFDLKSATVAHECAVFGSVLYLAEWVDFK